MVNVRDLHAVLALMDDEVEIRPRIWALEGGYRGHEGVRRWWGNLLDFLPDYTAKVGELRDIGDVTLARIRGRGRGVAGWWRNFAAGAEALESVQPKAG